MKKVQHIIVALLAVICVYGCNDKEFLTENPKTTYSTDNIFASSAQVDQAVIGCYSFTRQIFNFNKQTDWGAMVLRGNIGTDMYETVFANVGQLFSDYSNISADHPAFSTIFAWWYDLISKANLAIHGAELETVSWESESEKAYILAQARFFRAWAYKNLGIEFGGVPLVKEFVTEAHYDYVRSTRLETYQYAIDEMEAILPDLPETIKENGRLVKAAAQHNLSELYLAKGIVLEQESKSAEAKAAYTKAVEYANKVIDGGTYSLMKTRFGTRKTEDPVLYWASTVAKQTPDHLYTAAGVNIKGNVYWDLFQIGNQDYQDGNTESIWTMQGNLDARFAGDKGARFCYSRMFSPCFSKKSNESMEGNLEDVGGKGFGYSSPTYYTRDTIYAGKWADDMRNSDAVYRRIYVGNKVGSKYYGKVVPWDDLYKVDLPVGDASDLIRTRIFPVSCKTCMDKYPDISLTDDQRQHVYRDDYYIRLPETILLRAEAKMRLGDNAGAASDINKLRERAQCSYMVVASDVNLDLILDERARELVYEEMRWNTLFRMGGTVAMDRIKKYNSCFGFTQHGHYKDINLWPIPQSVIDTNMESPIEQNPGW